MKLKMGANSHVIEALSIKLQCLNYSIALKILEYYFITLKKCIDTTDLGEG